MLDPAICAGRTVGAPHVDLVALVDLKRLLFGTVEPANRRQ